MDYHSLLFTWITLSIWVVMYPPYRNAFVDCIIFRRRANGIDVSSFEVVCVGVKISKDKILQREVAIIKSHLGNGREFIDLLNQTITYEAPTK